MKQPDAGQGPVPPFASQEYGHASRATRRALRNDREKPVRSSNALQFSNDIFSNPETATALWPWPADAFTALTEAHFEALAALAPELVIFGSGSRIRFVRPALLRPLTERRIGVETMDTAAACRTYNVLLAEGRRVAAALIPL